MSGKEYRLVSRKSEARIPAVLIPSYCHLYLSLLEELSHSQTVRMGGGCPYVATKRGDGLLRLPDRSVRVVALDSTLVHPDAVL